MGCATVSLRLLLHPISGSVRQTHFPSTSLSLFLPLSFITRNVRWYVFPSWFCQILGSDGIYQRWAPSLPCSKQAISQWPIPRIDLSFYLYYLVLFTHFGLVYVCFIDTVDNLTSKLGDLSTDKGIWCLCVDLLYGLSNVVNDTFQHLHPHPHLNPHLLQQQRLLQQKLLLIRNLRTRNLLLIKSLRTKQMVSQA